MPTPLLSPISLSGEKLGLRLDIIQEGATPTLMRCIMWVDLRKGVILWIFQNFNFDGYNRLRLLTDLPPRGLQWWEILYRDKDEGSFHLLTMLSITVMRLHIPQWEAQRLQGGFARVAKLGPYIRNYFQPSMYSHLTACWLSPCIVHIL